VSRDQQEVIAFLSTAGAYGGRAEAVERVDTHISVVFLAGDTAYKLKRAVAFPYVDFTALEARRQACQREVALNRRTAPDLYRGVVAVTRDAAGALALGGDGEPVDWLVEMRRFDQEQMLDRLALDGRLDAALARTLAARVAAFHERAALRPDHGGAAGMRWVDEDNQR
jgi:aminoglycoside phosphotransferase family enzyme